MKSGNRELVDRLAAEYVLGTLRGHARRHFERWLVSPQVKGMVNSWESRLVLLEPLPQQVPPPPQVWQAIEQNLGLRKLGRRPFGRWLVVGVSLAIAGAAGVILLR
jgi:anti-sigma-K factor RskA